MKKFLVLLTILAAVSNAAVLELSVDGIVNGAGVDQAISLNPSDTVMIDVHCTADPGYPDYWISIEGDGSLTSVGTVISPPGPQGTMSDYYGDGSWYYFSASATVVEDLDVGKWWEAEFHCDGPATVVITLYDGSINPLDTITITQPEPMTMALLGLGGLFLRRRK